MNGSIIGLKMGTARQRATIVDVNSKLEDTDPVNERVMLSVKMNTGNTMDIGEVWLRNYRKELVARSLWVNKDHTNAALSSTCVLALLLQYLGVSDPVDLIGKEVFVEPKPNGYPAIVAYED
jgi:hypothetical protein